MISSFPYDDDNDDDPEVKGVIVIVIVTVMYVVNSCVMIASVFSDYLPLPQVI